MTTATGDPKAEFLDAAVWHGTLERADAILAAHPEIAGSDIYMAAILADDAAVRRFLETDPANATAKGGPRGWDALTYLCFSKYLRLDPARSEAFVRAATALLDAGASPNTGFYDSTHQPQPTIESVLYGAAGVAHHPEMTRLLLERGADPNDGEVAYHTPETLDNRAMKVLVESGKLTPESMMWLLTRKLNWHDYEGVAWLLDHGVDANFQAPWGNRPLHQALQDGVAVSVFELFMDHGADPTLPGREGKSSFALAARMARADVLDLFEKWDFTADLQGDDAFLSACTRGDRATAWHLLAADPGLIQRIQAQNEALLIDFAGTDNTAALALMLDLGFDLSAARKAPNWLVGETALHVAAGRGLLANAKLLIDRGAPLEAKNTRGYTPLGVAVRCFEQQSEWTPNDYTPAIAQALINAGANVESAGMTLAAAVCLRRTEDQTRLTHEAGPTERQIALAAAAYYGVASAIPMLIGLGADPNGGNLGLHPHATPLHNAVCSGSLETVKALVALGAKPDSKDGWHHATPLSWAEYFVRETRDPPKQDTEIAAYLHSLIT
jgi:ankyrin repeat protein